MLFCFFQDSSPLRQLFRVAQRKLHSDVVLGACRIGYDFLRHPLSETELSDLHPA